MLGLFATTKQGQAMKLDRYLRRRRISQTDFAKKAKISTGTISLLINNKTWISREYAQRIDRATAGRVTANDFVYKTR
jgi:plasmid maintenance system antidote protein VapI